MRALGETASLSVLVSSLTSWLSDDGHINYV